MRHPGSGDVGAAPAADRTDSATLARPRPHRAAAAGRPLRDRHVLRLIALDRVVHFLVLGVLAAAVFLFATNRDALSQTFYRVLDAVQGRVGGPTGEGGGGLLGELQKAFAAKPSTLWIVGLILACYALLDRGSAKSDDLE